MSSSQMPGTYIPVSVRESKLAELKAAAERRAEDVRKREQEAAAAKEANTRMNAKQEKVLFAHKHNV
jgi:hypothetical protein